MRKQMTEARKQEIKVTEEAWMEIMNLKNFREFVNLKNFQWLWDEHQLARQENKWLWDELQQAHNKIYYQGSSSWE